MRMLAERPLRSGDGEAADTSSPVLRGQHRKERKSIDPAAAGGDERGAWSFTTTPNLKVVALLA